MMTKECKDFVNELKTQRKYENISLSSFTKTRLNPFSTVSRLYLVKISENLGFSDVFRGYGKWSVGWKFVKIHFTPNSFLAYLPWLLSFTMNLFVAIFLSFSYRLIYKMT